MSFSNGPFLGDEFVHFQDAFPPNHGAPGAVKTAGQVRPSCWPRTGAAGGVEGLGLI